MGCKSIYVNNGVASLYFLIRRIKEYSGNIVSKHDILEIYLNMIEFVPNVYGIEDASKFYFGKPFSELNIVEVIVLTDVIPRPIYFYEALLQKTEQLRRNLNNHIKQYLSVALQKKIITRECLKSIGTDHIIFADEFGTLSLA